jgi:hypothetical protein
MNFAAPQYLNRRYQLRLALRQLGQDYERKLWGRDQRACAHVPSTRRRPRLFGQAALFRPGKGRSRGHAANRARRGRAEHPRQGFEVVLLAFLLTVAVWAMANLPGFPTSHL